MLTSLFMRNDHPKVVSGYFVLKGVIDHNMDVQYQRRML